MGVIGRYCGIEPRHIEELAKLVGNDVDTTGGVYGLDQHRTEIKNKSAAILVFIIFSYLPFWIVYSIGKLLNLPFSFDPSTISGLMVFGIIFTPLISSLLTIRIFQGKGQIKFFFKKTLRWRFSPVWYLAAILIPVMIAILSTAAAIVLKGTNLPEKWFYPSFSFSFLLIFLICNGIGEEFGWRGFALPVLQDSLGSLGGSIVIGVIWALWHLPLFYMPGSMQYGDSIFLYVSLLISWSVVMTFLQYKAHGSVLVAILFHETINFIAFTCRYPGDFIYIIWGFAAFIIIYFLPRPLFILPVRTNLTT